MTIAVALAVMLQIVLVTVTPELSYDGLLAKGGSAIGKPIANCFSRVRPCGHADSWLGMGKIAGAPGFFLSSSSLRFDLKQNLSNWPVLSDGLERSPPLLLIR
jgi:hypothetical protein